MHNRKRKNMFIMIAAICTILVMTTGYAILTQVIKVDGTVAVERDWEVKITGITDGSPTGAAANEYAPKFDETTAVFTTLLYNKGDSMTYTITIENFGSWDAQVNAISTYDTENPAVKFTITGVAEGDILESGAKHELKVKVEYDSTFTGTLENNVGIIAIKLTYGQKGSEIIGGTTGDSSIYNPDVFKTAADKLRTKAVASGDGLYTDPVEEGKYVYRGEDPDNYIILDGATYRIVSVEADDTIKVIKQYNIGCQPWDVVGNRTITGYCEDTYTRACNAWGSSATTFDATGNIATQMPRVYGGTTYDLPTSEASLNTYLNTTFLQSLSSELQSKIVTHSFNVGVSAETSAQTLATDISQESSYKWKGKVGLISLTDYVNASTNSECTNQYAYKFTDSCYNNSNTHNYLFSSDNFTWFITPDDDTTGFATMRTPSGNSGGTPTTDSIAVLPSFYLTSDINLSGNGTKEIPYCVDGINCNVEGTESNVGTITTTGSYDGCNLTLGIG